MNPFLTINFFQLGVGSTTKLAKSFIYIFTPRKPHGKLHHRFHAKDDLISDAGTSEAQVRFIETINGISPTCWKNMSLGGDTYGGFRK